MQKNFLALTISTVMALSSSAVFAKEYIVDVVSDYENMRMVFEPSELHIKKGDTVIWVNKANESHNALTYPDGYPEGGASFASPYLEKEGDKWSHSFDVSGTYEYHCIPHIMMGMRGKIIVDHPSTKGQMHKPSSEERKAYRDKLLEFFDEEDFSHMPAYVSDKLKKVK